MRILYHSAPPTADTGYGVHTRHLTRKLRGLHDVDIHSVGGFEGMGIDWEDIHIYPAGAGKFGEQSIPYWFNKTEADIVFSHHDHWSFNETLNGIQRSGIPMVLYTILDHDMPGKRAPEAVVKANENSLHTIVMSKWAEERVINSRIEQDKVSQIPHGVNTSKYAPVTHNISKEELKRDLGIPEDAFLFGMVAANYGPRKNIPHHMEAFSRLVKDYGADDAYLYIHTHPTMGGGYNLYDVRNGLNLSQDRCLFPDPHEMYHGLEDMIVVQLYNTFDVHLNATQSESWGLTITEAMSTATPVIATNYSAMTEQFGVPYNTFVTQDEGFRVTDQGILLHRGAEMWTQNATARRFTPNVDDLYDAMVYYYENRELIDEHGQNARDWVVENYDWDYVYDKYWEPLFNDIEEELDDEYDEWYFKKREAETQSQAFKQEALEISLEVRGNSVIDVGCGTGALAEYLEEKKYEVVGVDKSEHAIEKSQEKDIEVYRNDILDLQFKDNTFDTAVAQHVLEHVEPDAAALTELTRVASKKVICVVPIGSPVGQQPDSTEIRRYDKNELERLKEEYNKLSNNEMQYEKINVSDNSSNWMITVDINS